MTLKNVSETPGPVKRLSSLQSGIAPGQVQAGVTAVQADSGTHGPGARVVSAVPREHPTSGCPGLAGGRNLGLPAAGSPPELTPLTCSSPRSRDRRTPPCRAARAAMVTRRAVKGREKRRGLRFPPQTRDVGAETAPTLSSNSSPRSLRLAGIGPQLGGGTWRWAETVPDKLTTDLQGLTPGWSSLNCF